MYTERDREGERKGLMVSQPGVSIISLLCVWAPGGRSSLQEVGGDVLQLQASANFSLSQFKGLYWHRKYITLPKQVMINKSEINNQK
jgi:hypothetical protein